MDPLRVAIRCLVTFIFLFAMLRIAGKKVVSQSTAFDFVLSLIVGDLVDDFLFSEVPGAEFVVAVTTLVVIDLIVKYMSHRSAQFDYLTNGRPTMVFYQGAQVDKGLGAERMHRSDLLALLRIKGFDEQREKEIKVGVLEDSGELSLIRKKQMEPLQKKEKAVLRKRKK